MFKAIYNCNVCGAQKQEANHWLVARVGKDCSQIYNRLEIRAFDDGTSDDEHLCGSTCLIKRIAAFTDELQRAVQSVEDDNAIMRATNE